MTAGVRFLQAFSLTFFRLDKLAQCVLHMSLYLFHNTLFLQVNDVLARLINDENDRQSNHKRQDKIP
ncbi:hypothetical protein VIAG107301_15380 [Vibrio agarivorans]